MTKRFESPNAHYKFHACERLHGNPLRASVCEAIYTAILIYTHTVYVCVRSCVQATLAVSARTAVVFQCVSV